MALVLDEGLLEVDFGGTIEDRLRLIGFYVVNDHSCILCFSTVVKVPFLRNGEPLLLTVVAEAYSFAPVHAIKLCVV